MSNGMNFQVAEQDLARLANKLTNQDSLDPQTRQSLQKAVQRLSLALEKPRDTFMRIAYLPLQTAVVRIGLDLGIFKILVSAGRGGKSSDDLASETHADSTLLSPMP
ncbi:hypothetical protein MMC25_006391 [Agyrium rufum]|nr:hypothetical protein [Agyrium rufum]